MRIFLNPKSILNSFKTTSTSVRRPQGRKTKQQPRAKKIHMTKTEAVVENQWPRTQVTSNNLQIQDAAQRLEKSAVGKPYCWCKHHTEPFNLFPLSRLWLRKLLLSLLSELSDKKKCWKSQAFRKWRLCSSKGENHSQKGVKNNYLSIYLFIILFKHIRALLAPFIY